MFSTTKGKTGIPIAFMRVGGYQNMIITNKVIIDVLAYLNNFTNIIAV